jgi:hypothetical protein
MTFADVIMPFTAIYFAWLWFFPINLLALGVEVVVFKIAYPKLPPEITLGYILAANAASFLAGGFIATLVEVMIVKRRGAPFWGGSDPDYRIYVIVGIIFALLLSIYIELRVLQRLSRKRGLRSLDKTCAIANVASYAVIVGAFQLLFGF